MSEPGDLPVDVREYGSYVFGPRVTGCTKKCICDTDTFFYDLYRVGRGFLFAIFAL